MTEIDDRLARLAARRAGTGPAETAMSGDRPDPVRSDAPRPDAVRPMSTRRADVKRPMPAQASKIIAAGLSTSMILGLVAVMGWTAEAETAEQPAPSPAPVAPSSAALLPAAPSTVPAATGSIVGVPDQPLTEVLPVDPVPAETVPPAAPQPVVVELTVPQAQPASGGGGASAASTQSN